MYNHHEICKNYNAEVSDFEKDNLCIEFRWHALCIRFRGQADIVILWAKSYTVLRLRPNIYFGTN